MRKNSCKLIIKKLEDHMFYRNLILKNKTEKGNLESNFLKIPYSISECHCLDRGFAVAVTSLIHKNKFLLTGKTRPDQLPNSSQFF